MRMFVCSCGNALFFENTVCINCRHEVGWCPVCRGIVDVIPNADGTLHCTACQTPLTKCTNYATFNVCNRFVRAADAPQAPDAVPPTTESSTADGSPPAVATPPAKPLVLCDYCRFNHTVPDLSIDDNQEKWARLEAAKRRCLYGVELVGLPFGNQSDGISPPLVFEFKGDVVSGGIYRDMGGDSGEKVYTGHANGTITINIQEADDVTREKLRVEFHEPHRSLLGHFRHEFGHYIWEVTVRGKREAECVRLFGDHNNPTYSAALQDYYKSGPKAGWVTHYVSAYATMHPWEDFAETFAVFLDMASALDTAYRMELIRELHLDDIDWMAKAYQKLGIALNEMNRANGLLDYLPEVIAPTVLEKLRFIHGLAKPALEEKLPQKTASAA